MRKPKYPGQLIEKMNQKKMSPQQFEKSPLDKAIDKATGFKEGSAKDNVVDKAVMKHLHKVAAHLDKHAEAHGMDSHLHKVAKHLEKAVSHMKPKGAEGRSQVARLGRTYKTGGFNRISKEAGKKYGSKAAGERVAGAIFNHMAQKHAHKGKMKPSKATC